ncbi:amidophosphoribosyltransferase [Colletotrichum spaethianum]|uniref:Amidophosphoribosyltransferase n=1 Tax=Colletotrichum spaethianum TaxID=700344 RepID=A0AA37PD29_9PEZI|nr:amidophosphoribosyltransferase [Colletotrichum spaethianum]GKT50008.1 amidophosphoribosyltransferase [Colletotrichum spaethianum]
MCGIIGICLGHWDRMYNESFSDEYVLTCHRGQDACGIATSSGGRSSANRSRKHGRIFSCKDAGMASKVFNDGRRVIDLPGWMGIGHLRYPTWGSSGPYGVCLSHNGNLINAEELREFLDHEAHRHVNTGSDSELMLSVFANELNETGKARVNENDLFSALERTYKRCKGAWASVIMLAGYGVCGFRDPNGIRP